MYVEDFNAFYQQAEELLLKDPIKTRYVVKYRHTAGQLVLKVTDDVVVRSELLGSCAVRLAGMLGGCSSRSHLSTCTCLFRAQCLKYKTDQQVDIRKMEKLNALFFAVTATGERPSGEQP